jgi:LPXTG-motif cell wall-anchored protein
MRYYRNLTLTPLYLALGAAAIGIIALIVIKKKK